MVIGFIIGFTVSGIIFIALGIAERSDLIDELNEEKRNNYELQDLYMDLQNELHGIKIKSLEDDEEIITILDYKKEDDEDETK